jgi:two-component system sensor histidine kinase/response regulator
MKDHPETELFDEGKLLHTLIDNMPDHIYIKDRSSKFILANQKIASTHGLKSGSEMIGKSDHNYYPKELADKYYGNEQEIINSGKPLIGIEEKALNEKGEEIYLSTTKIPFRDKNGNIIGIVGIGRDITVRKQAETKLFEHAQELQHVNTLLEEKQEEIRQQSEELVVQAENMQMANLELQKLTVAVSETDNVVLILDAEGNFEWVNKSFTRVYGQTLEEYIRQHGRNLLEGSHNPHIGEILTRCRESGKTIRYQSEATDASGNKIWTQSTLTPVFDDRQRIIRFVAIDADITALKKAQDLINHQKSELETRGKQLEEANITKDKFFSIIAHDLKNPFHSIMGFTDLMARNYDQIDDARKREYLGLINESTQYAHNLLENLLNWSRAQTNSIRYNPAKTELHSPVLEIYRILHSSMEKKNLNFESRVPENTMAFADPNMIQTILRNLLSNAIKFTPENGSIWVSAKARGDRIVVSVQDTGMGIPEDQQKKLFSFGEFHTTKGTDGEQGTGLGLLICHEFVKKHGGALRLESSPGAGTTFYFDIPSNP